MGAFITDHRAGFRRGYTPVTTAGGPGDDSGISLGVLKLAAGERHATVAAGETAWLLMSGHAENLATLLPRRRVVMAPYAPSQAVSLRVDLTLVEAGRQTDGNILLEARWALLGEKGETLVQRRTARSHPSSSWPEASAAMPKANGMVIPTNPRYRSGGWMAM